MKSIDFRTNWIPDFLPIGSLWLETSATALRGPYVINDPKVEWFPPMSIEDMSQTRHAKDWKATGGHKSHIALSCHRTHAACTSSHQWIHRVSFLCEDGTRIFMTTRILLRAAWQHDSVLMHFVTVGTSEPPSIMNLSQWSDCWWFARVYWMAEAASHLRIGWASFSTPD